MRVLNDQEINPINAGALLGGLIPDDFVFMTTYYGAALGTTAGAIMGAIKVGKDYGYIWGPVGFFGGSLMGAVAGMACGAISAIPLSAIFCPPDFSKLGLSST